MENTQRSSQSFCRAVGCRHARSMHGDENRPCCLCSCTHFVAPQSPEARAIGPKAVEPSPNAMARNAAVYLLKGVLNAGVIGPGTRADIEAVLVCLEVIT